MDIELFLTCFPWKMYPTHRHTHHTQCHTPANTSTRKYTTNDVLRTHKVQKSRDTLILHIHNTYTIYTKIHNTYTYTTHTQHIRNTYTTHTQRTQQTHTQHTQHIQTQHRQHTRHIHDTYTTHTQYTQHTEGTQHTQHSWWSNWCSTTLIVKLFVLSCRFCLSVCSHVAPLFRDSLKFPTRVCVVVRFLAFRSTGTRKSEK